MGHYDFNNTYQYVVAREETHLSWIAAALGDLETEPPLTAPALPTPTVGTMKDKTAAAAYRAVLKDDASHLGEFAERWVSRIADLSHARNRLMLQVIIGESHEHQRLFGQAASGFEDVLGRRTGGVDRQGTVLSTRWVE
jgi:hypothetical protein